MAYRIPLLDVLTPSFGEKVYQRSVRGDLGKDRQARQQQLDMLKDQYQSMLGPQQTTVANTMPRQANIPGILGGGQDKGMLGVKALQSGPEVAQAKDMERKKLYEDAYNAARMKITSGYTPTGIFGVGGSGASGSPFMGKLNPSLYTPESLQAFMNSGGKDYSVLEYRWGLSKAPSGYIPSVDEGGDPRLDYIPGGPQDPATMQQQKGVETEARKEVISYEADKKAEQARREAARADKVTWDAYNTGLETIDSIYSALDDNPGIGRVRGRISDLIDDPAVANINSNLTLLATQYAKSVNGARVTDADVEQAMKIVGNIMDGPESLRAKLGNLERMFTTGKGNLQSRQSLNDADAIKRVNEMSDAEIDRELGL